MTEELSPDKFVEVMVSRVMRAVMSIPMRAFAVTIVILVRGCYRIKPKAVNRRIWAYLRGWTC